MGRPGAREGRSPVFKRLVLKGWRALSSPPPQGRVSRISPLRSGDGFQVLAALPTQQPLEAATACVLDLCPFTLAEEVAQTGMSALFLG